MKSIIFWDMILFKYINIILNFIFFILLILLIALYFHFTLVFYIYI
jgi:hypothetical protein